MKTNNIVEEMETFLIKNKKSLSKNHFQVLSYLLKMYKKLSENFENIEFLDYCIQENSYYFSFKKMILTDSFFIEGGEKHLELRFFGHEQMFFYDDNFMQVYKDLIDDFFKGKYIVNIFKNQKGKSVKKEIFWDNKKLKHFNESYFTGKTTIFNKKEEYKGINFFK